jgi:hypothetical protein
MKKNTFLPFTLLPHGVKKKKAKKYIHHQKKNYHLNFFLAFTAKKNEFSCPKK